jgi:hypothetical protein
MHYRSHQQGSRNMAQDKIEAAAKAMAESLYGAMAWDSPDRTDHDFWRDLARAAASALKPLPA